MCGFSFTARSVLLLACFFTERAVFRFSACFYFRGGAKPHESDKMSWCARETDSATVWVVKVDVACVCLHPGDRQERGRVSRVMLRCRCKQRQSIFPPHSPLPLCLCSQKGCWEINLDFQLPLHLPLLRVGWFPWEPAPGYRE